MNEAPEALVWGHDETPSPNSFKARNRETYEHRLGLEGAGSITVRDPQGVRIGTSQGLFLGVCMSDNMYYVMLIDRTLTFALPDISALKLLV
jgi:hypothetical protein